MWCLSAARRVQPLAAVSERSQSLSLVLSKQHVPATDRQLKKRHKKQLALLPAVTRPRRASKRNKWKFENFIYITVKTTALSLSSTQCCYNNKCAIKCLTHRYTHTNTYHMWFQRRLCLLVCWPTHWHTLTIRYICSCITVHFLLPFCQLLLSYSLSSSSSSTASPHQLAVISQIISSLSVSYCRNIKSEQQQQQYNLE